MMVLIVAHAHIQVQHAAVVIVRTRVMMKVVLWKARTHRNTIAAIITHLQMSVTHLSVLISNNNYAEEKKVSSRVFIETMLATPKYLSTLPMYLFEQDFHTRSKYKHCKSVIHG
jgi:hypothetical protein